MGEFFKADVGKLCENPVNNEEQCKVATNHFSNAVYSTLKGPAYQLPFGCIWDAVTPEQIFVYWNPYGYVLSTDSNIRQVCQSVNS